MDTSSYGLKAINEKGRESRKTAQLKQFAELAAKQLRNFEPRNGLSRFIQNAGQHGWFSFC